MHSGVETANLSIEAEVAFAHRLVDVAEAILHHTNMRRCLVIDGSITAAIIEPRPPRRDLE